MNTLRFILSACVVLLSGQGMTAATKSHEQARSSRIKIIFQKIYADIFAKLFPKKPISHDSSEQQQLITEFDQMVAKTAALSVPLPTSRNNISAIAGGDSATKIRIAQQARDVTVVCPSNFHSLVQNFLSYKSNFGSDIEKKYYAGMDHDAFVQRLIAKRPLMFMNPSDDFVLRNGISGNGGFELIGTNHEKAPLILSDYLSYDEMALAALLQVFVPTFFINNGNRHNLAQKADDGTFELEGVYAGLVGARFERPGYMEWQYTIVTPNRDVWLYKSASYVAMWEQFYAQQLPTYGQALADRTGRYISFHHQSVKCFFDTRIYKARMKAVIEPFLQEAAARGRRHQKSVYIHAVGLGLGVWQIVPQQAQLLLDAYVEVLNSMNRDDVRYLSDINFSWFPESVTFSTLDRSGLWTAKSGHTVSIIFSKRNPADRLLGKDAEKLLIAQYAWDGNAYPGNEYWAHSLTASGDPAAACCSTIAQLQNPEINPHIFSKKTYVLSII